MTVCVRGVVLWMLMAATVAAQDTVAALTLDGLPGLVVVQCSGEVWAAFDPTDGSLVKAWNGDVTFDEQGALISRGHVYTSAEAAPGWELLRGDEVLTGTRTLSGFDGDEGWLRLHGQVDFSDGTTVAVTEHVDAWRDGRRREGRPIAMFDRSFVAEAVPQGATLRVWLEALPDDVVWQGEALTEDDLTATTDSAGQVRAPFALEPGERCTWTRIWPRCRDAWLPQDELPEVANVLSAAEVEAGWRWLFDGQDASAWRGAGRDDLPEGWVVEDGCLVRRGGGDLVTRESFEDFELSLQWRISPGGNSGLFFHVDDSLGPVYMSGPEYQLLDNQGHPNGRLPETSAASNYGLEGPVYDLTMPLGFFNRTFLRVRDGVVEHWLNGFGVLRYELGSPAWEALVADSKFAAWEHYGRLGKGAIALQDHGDTVWFRAIKIRPLE